MTVSVGDEVRWVAKKKTMRGVVAQVRVVKPTAKTTMAFVARGEPIPEQHVADVVVRGVAGLGEFRVLPVDRLEYDGVGSVTEAREGYEAARKAMLATNAEAAGAFRTMAVSRGLSALQPGAMVTVPPLGGKIDRRKATFVGFTAKWRVCVVLVAEAKRAIFDPDYVVQL